MPWLATRDRRRLHVRVVGRGDPCLLVHGFASDGSSWLPFVTPWLGRHRFIVPDLAGFGRSHAAPLGQPCPLTAYAHDLADVLDALEVDRVRIVGISMGAFAALQYMRLYGQTRVRSYLHVDQGLMIRSRSDQPHGLLGTQQARFFSRLGAVLDAVGEERALDALAPAVRKELLALFGEFCAAGFAGRVLPWLVRGAARREVVARRMMPVANLSTHFAIMRAYLERDYDMRDVVAGLQVPVTALIGARSRMYPPEGQRILSQLCPHARVREVAGTGHMIPLESPLRFARELGTFLSAP